MEARTPWMRVVHQLGQLLVDERIVGGRPQLMVSQSPRPWADQGAARRRFTQQLTKPLVALRRSERHDDVVSPASARSMGRGATERSRAGNARFPTITGWTNSTETRWAAVT